MLATWMKDHNSQRWSEGLRFVQFMKNKTFHSGIKMFSYKAMFSVEPRVGLRTKILDNEIISRSSTEKRFGTDF